MSLARPIPQPYEAKMKLRALERAAKEFRQACESGTNHEIGTAWQFYEALRSKLGASEMIAIARLVRD